MLIPVGFEFLECSVSSNINGKKVFTTSENIYPINASNYEDQFSI